MEIWISPKKRTPRLTVTLQYKLVVLEEGRLASVEKKMRRNKKDFFLFQLNSLLSVKLSMINSCKAVYLGVVLLRDLRISHTTNKQMLEKRKGGQHARARHIRVAFACRNSFSFLASQSGDLQPQNYAIFDTSTKLCRNIYVHRPVNSRYSAQLNFLVPASQQQMKF